MDKHTLIILAAIAVGVYYLKSTAENGAGKAGDAAGRGAVDELEKKARNFWDELTGSTGKDSHPDNAWVA